MTSPDSVCVAYGRRPVDLCIKKLDRDMILIEGTRRALEFLARRLTAQATFKKDCGFQIGPRSAGRKLFDRRSKFGIYIHRLPCSKGRTVGRAWVGHGA